MGDVVYIDGRFVDAAQATIPVMDLGVLRGYGVFDFLRTYNRQPFHIEAHIERLFQSAAAIDMPLPWEPAHIRQIVEQAIARSTHDECGVRIVVTGGDTLTTLAPAGDPRLIVICNAIQPPDLATYRRGLRVITVPDERSLTNVKSIDYIPAIRGRKRAAAQGAADVLYLDADGNAREATTCNLFAFCGDRLVTPVEGVLLGVTRSVLLELAQGTHPIEERRLPLAELLQADEAFLTGSVIQVMPLTQIDGQPIGDGQPGPRTLALMRQFAACTGKDIYPGL